MNTSFKYSNEHVLHGIIRSNKFFPNNDSLPFLIYKLVFVLPLKKAADIIEAIFKANDWLNAWRNGIYDYHHYHSITHEVLGVFNGWCDVALGGDDANIYKIEKGDVLIIPAGVAHKNIKSSDNFSCVGAYPGGYDFDIKYGHPAERPEADNNIRKVPLPATDPVYGNGPLQLLWK